MLSTPERKCISAPEQRCIDDERREGCPQQGRVIDVRDFELEPIAIVGVHAHVQLVR